MSYTSITTKKRLVAMLVMIAIVFFAIFFRIFFVQFVQGAELQQRALDQWVRDIEVAAKRGAILDRNNTELAKTITSDAILLRPGEIKKANNADKVADTLAEILKMNRDDIYAKATDETKSEIWLKRQVDKDISERIKQENLAGVAFSVDSKRYYPNNDLASQTLGFTTNDGEGLSGIEQIYNKYLAGQDGKITTETDKDGRRIPSSREEIQEAVQGYDVRLTIDYAIQSFLESSLKEAYINNKAKSVSGIVMDPNTGEILAMATYPSLDLNNLPRNNQDLLQQYTRNVIISDAYELGSVVKTLTVATGIDSGIFSESNHYNCTGSIVINGSDRIKCASSAHGNQNLSQALNNSCNPAFVQMGLSIGKDTMYEYLGNFGIFQRTGINFPGESKGISLDIGVARDGNVARMAFGHSISMTPLQFTTAFSAIVNGGTLYKPYVTKEISSAETGEIIEQYEPVAVKQVISKNTSDRMTPLLKAVVEEGSGKRARIPGYSVGGKTGTAQKYENGKIAQGKYIASFIGAAPIENPQLVCYVMLDEPGTSDTYGSVVAAPVVRSVLESSLKYLGVTINKEEMNDKGEVVVPDLVGMTTEKAKEYLKTANLEAVVLGDGIVKSQIPKAKEKVYKDSDVIIYTDSAITNNREIEVPDISGLKEADAKIILTNLGLKVKTEGNLEGICYEQSIEKGTKVANGKEITLKFK